MCTKLLEWFNNEFLFMFESKKFKEYKESNTNQLQHNIKIIIEEPKISKSNSNESIPSTPSSIGLISKDEYDLYTWDIL
jgi:hypothetical protein